MVSLTMSVPPKLRERMRKHKEIRWSHVVRAILEQQLDEIERADYLASTSKLTQKDVDEIASMVDEDMAIHFKRLGNATRR